MDAKPAGARLLDGWVTEHELAAELNRNIRTLQRWRDRRIGPPFAMMGDRPIYNVENVRRWLTAGGAAKARATTRPRKASTAPTEARVQ
jgi:hypothetical protein